MNQSRRRMLLMTTMGVVFAASAAEAANGQRARPRQIARTPRQPQSKAVTHSLRGGGHLNRHVARTPQQLRAGAASKNARLNFSNAAYGGKKAPVGFKGRAHKASRALERHQASKRQVSTFKNGATADRFYGQALRNNRDKIRTWLADPKRTTPLPIDFRGKGAGSVFSAKSNSYMTADKGQFFLAKNGSGKTFFPHSAKLW